MLIRSHADRDLTSHISSFTEEYGFHGPAEEPLTLFPDGERGPLFAAPALAIDIALLIRVLGD